MRLPTPVLAALGLAVVLGGGACGKKGDLLPPLSKVPSPPSEVRAVQRGAAVWLEWTDPATYIDGHPLAGLSAVEVWLAEERDENGQAAARQPAAEAFAAQAVLAARLPSAVPPSSGTPAAPTLPAGRFTYPLTSIPPDGTRLVFGLRAADSRRRLSGFSGLAAVPIRILPSPPAGLAAEVGGQAIELRWDPPPDNIDGSVPALVAGYDLYRASGGAAPERLNSAPVTATRFSDTTFEFDQDLVYTVRAVGGGAEPLGQSADSAPVALRPEDTFAPAAPTGLLALAGPDFVSLSWDAGPEKDLAGYRVFRRPEGSGDFAELTPNPIRETTFQDPTAERSRRYEYAVTAEDARGNRSGRSAPVVVGIKEERL